MKTFAKGAPTAVCIIFLLSGLVLMSGGLAVAQTSPPKPVPSPPPTVPADSMSADKSSISDDKAPLTTFEEEMRAKRLIKLAEKEHQENLNRAHEISQLGKELQENLKKKPTLDRDDAKKLERLEKLTRKVRGEAGGGDNEVKIVDKPSDVASAGSKIAEAAESLSKDVQSTPRQVVSAGVIDHANVLLELIRILRTLTVR